MLNQLLLAIRLGLAQPAWMTIRSQVEAVGHLFSGNAGRSAKTDGSAIGAAGDRKEGAMNPATIAVIALIVGSYVWAR